TTCARCGPETACTRATTPTCWAAVWRSMRRRARRSTGRCWNRIKPMFDNASILITGGSGSFGKTYIRTLLERYKPRRLIVYSRDELKQFEMQQVFTDPAMRWFLGDVRDRDRM